MLTKNNFFIGPQLILIALILWGLSGCAMRKGAISKEERRYDRLSNRAYRLMEKDRYEKAAKLYATASEIVKDHYPVFCLALAHAKTERADQFWEAIEEAESRGYDIAWEMEEEPAFRKYQSDLRFQQLVKKIKQNQKENCLAQRESTLVPTTDSAPLYTSLEDLEQTFDNEKSIQTLVEWKLPYVERRIRHNIRIAKKIAALKRYIQDNPEAPDNKDAHLIEIEAWKSLTGWSHWNIDVAQGLEEAINDFIAKYTEASQREELEFYLIESRLRGVVEGKHGCSEDDEEIPLNCEEMMPLMDQFISKEDESSPWITRALGLKANCMFELSPDHPENARETYEYYLARHEIPDEEKKVIDWALSIELRRLKFLLNGAPDFTAETIDGKKVRLSDFKGQVVLLDFWGPG